MEYLAWFVLLFLGVRSLISTINLLSHPYLADLRPQGQPFISVLIPARNEENSLGTLLSNLKNQAYCNFEVLIYDDQSEDDTPAIIRSFQQKDDRFRLIAGRSVPNDWKGKNHACHQLAQRARGDYFLFLDADVHISPDLLKKSVATAQHYRLDLLSIFARQKMESLGERITVPIMNWILLSLLPLPLVSRTGFSSLSAANGQFMMFDASLYRQQQWHSRVKDTIVEDIAITRIMKSLGYRVQTLLGDTSIQCRMYDNYRAATRGFSRNVHAYFGNNYLYMFLFAIISSLGFIPVGLHFGWSRLIIYLGLEMINRITVSLASRQSALWNTLLAPVQLFAFMHISLKSLRSRYSGSTTWKGRNMKTK